MRIAIYRSRDSNLHGMDLNRCLSPRRRGRWKIVNVVNWFVLSVAVVVAQEMILKSKIIVHYFVFVRSQLISEWITNLVK